MRADNQSIVNPSARGRDSVRISSQNAYDEAIFVLDLAHMPAGCATWPSFWTKSQTGPWPVGGEVDIIEGMTLHLSLVFPSDSLIRITYCYRDAGINLRTENQANLHTTPGCTMPPGRAQTG